MSTSLVDSITVLTIAHTGGVCEPATPFLVVTQTAEGGVKVSRIRAGASPREVFDEAGLCYVAGGTFRVGNSRDTSMASFYVEMERLARFQLEVTGSQVVYVREAKMTTAMLEDALHKATAQRYLVRGHTAGGYFDFSVDPITNFWQEIKLKRE